MASKQSESIKTLYTSWINAMVEKPDMELHEIRGLFEHWGDITAEPEEVDYLEVEANGVRAMWAIPKDCAQDRVALCTHGGGYVTGSMYTHRKLFGHIAKKVGCKSLILHYRRAPEHTHPAQVNDAVSAYEWLLAEGYKPEHMFTTGDSAGGALATSVLLGIKNKKLPLPAASIPLSPWYDPEGTGKSLDINADKDCIVSKEVLANMSAMFLGGVSSKDPLANLLQADISGLPPIYIQVGEDEALLDDSLRFGELAKKGGVDIKVDVFPEMQHVFHFMAGNAPEADDAIEKMSDWVRPKIGL